MNAIVCTKCGSNDMVERGDSYICKHCGTKFAKQQTKAQRPVNINFVYNNNASSTRETSYEAELLDKEIRICKEYNRLKAQADKKPLGFADTIIGVGLWFAIPYFILDFLTHFLGMAEGNFIRTIIVWGIPSACAIWAYTKTSTVESREARERASNAPELERVTRMYNQITLIPEEYRHQDEALRNFYDNYGARTQKELMDRMVEYNKKVTIIKNYY